MASSDVEIANLAAIKIGAEARITSLLDDRKVARELNAVWAIERRATLRAGSFNFSTRRAKIASVVLAASDLIAPWAYAFPLPALCLRLLSVLDSTSGYERADAGYQLEGGPDGQRILSNDVGPLLVKYIIDIPEPARWDDAFAEAFACRLAWRCGKRVAGSSFDVDGAWRDFRVALGDANRVDARENPPIEQSDDSWIDARLSGGSTWDRTWTNGGSTSV